MSDAQTRATPSIEQLQGSQEYLATMIDVLQAQLNDAHSKLTTAQTNAQILQRANQKQALQIQDLLGKLVTLQTPPKADPFDCDNSTDIGPAPVLIPAPDAGPLLDRDDERA